MSTASSATPELDAELWSQADVLRSLHLGDDLVGRVTALEATPDFVDQSAYLSRRVNTALSSAEPIWGWARYREAYSPELVKLLLEMFPPPGVAPFVLDPMCGSGSSQLAAQSLGYMSVGLDVSPYATLLSRVKTTHLEHETVDHLRDWLTRFSACSAQALESSDATDAYLEPYFPKTNFETLLWIRSNIEQEFRADNAAREFLTVALLSVLEECSNRKKDGNGLASRPSKVDQPAAVFSTQVATMFDDLVAHPPSGTPSFTYTLPAKDLAVAVDDLRLVQHSRLGSIVFSPPYPNSFDYFESYKLELLFGRLFDLRSIRSARKGLIRSYRQSGKSQVAVDLPTVELTIDAVMSRIPLKERRTGVVDGRSRLLPNLLRGYFLDMRDVFEAGFAAMPPGTRMHIVVDQSAYLGVPIPTDLLLAELGMEAGLVFEQLTFCRRARTSAQQLRQAPLLGDLLRETVVTLRKG